MPEHVPTDVDQDADPPRNGDTGLSGPRPDPPLADDQGMDVQSDEGAHEMADDEVDGRSELSFLTSDPSATWAGPDRPD